MPTRPRTFRDELLQHGWWLVPLVLALWFRQLELPGPDAGPAPDESAHAVKGWELLTIVRLGIDSVSPYGRLGWFRGTPEMAQLYGWKFWAWEICLKLALCSACGLALLRTPGTLLRVGFALALLALPTGLDGLACVALLAIFRGQLAGGRAAWLAVAALLAQVSFPYFVVWAVGIAWVAVALTIDDSWKRAGAFLARGLGAFLFLWLALGQAPAQFPLWVSTSWTVVTHAGPALSLPLLALLALVALAASGRVGLALRALLFAGGIWWLGGLQPLAPRMLRQRASTLGAVVAEKWDLPRVRARAALETLDVFQDSQGIAILNGLNFHPRPVFQSRWAGTPELLELNRAFYASERAPEFALYRLEAPLRDAKALDELLLRYRPCFEERGWLLLQRAHEAPREHSATELERRQASSGEWIELARLPGEAIELRLDARRSPRSRLECEFERADGSRGRMDLAPGAARAGFLIRPFVETQAELARVFVGRPVDGVARLRVLSDSELDLTLLRRDGLLPPPSAELGLAIDFPDFDPPPQQLIDGESLRVEPQQGRAVHVFTAPASLRWQLQPGRYRMSASYGMLDSAWQVEQPSDGTLLSIVLWEGREQQVLFRRLLDPARAQPDRGFQPLDIEFELAAPADLFVRMRVGTHEDPLRDWVFWQDLRIERR